MSAHWFGRSMVTFDRGSRYRVESFLEPYSDLAQKLASLGIVRGTVIEVKNVAPWGDPVEIGFRGYSVSLRKDELSALNLIAVSRRGSR